MVFPKMVKHFYSTDGNYFMLCVLENTMAEIKLRLLIASNENPYISFRETAKIHILQMLSFSPEILPMTDLQAPYILPSLTRV